MDALHPYLPMDRRQALACGNELPEWSSGAALFADTSGFTQLTESLVRRYGPQRGAEELSVQLDRIYGALIAEVERFGGSIASYAGDAVTCWFDEDDGRTAVSCALAMQQQMQTLGQFIAPDGTLIQISMKVAIAAGSVRRMVVGEPQLLCFDVLAGATIARMAEAEHHANKGEIVVGEEVVAALRDDLTVAEWREAEGQRFAVVEGLERTVPHRPWPPLAEPLRLEQLRPWLLESIERRLVAGQAAYLAELRPIIPLFVRFGGLDYDNNPDAPAQLDAFMRQSQSILARYGGALLQLIVGDKGSYFYGTFGAPYAYDDGAARACAAAWEIAALRCPGITPPQVGVTSGRLWVGSYGSQQHRTFSALGNEVNMAARLMQRAEPGQALISPYVAEAADDRFTFRSLGDHQLKGMERPMTIWLLDGPRVQSSWELRGTALVGREQELAQLREALAGARDAAGRAVSIVGSAGIGKSHLASAIAEVGVAEGLRVQVGRCYSTGKHHPYLPWHALLAGLLGLERESIDVAQLHDLLAARNPELLPRLPLLADLLGLVVPETPLTEALDPRTRSEATISLALDLVRDAAVAQPLLLVIEDAHWIDEPSAALTIALVRALPSLPCALLIFQRPPQPDSIASLDDLLALEQHTTLQLGELSAAGVAALIRQHLSGAIEPLAIALVQALAQGNPFFTEELVLSLVEAQLLVNEHGLWQLAPAAIEALDRAGCLTRPDETTVLLAGEASIPATLLGLPETISGVVLSRIDRLPEEHRLTLKVASVVGPIFETQLLLRAHPLHPTIAQIVSQATTLEQRDFARIEQPPDLSYAFKHTITHEVAYSTLTGRQRRQLHQAVGEALEQAAPDAVEQLAHHFRLAEDRERALHYLELAAQRARREYANETALALYTSACELEDRWTWRLGQVEVLHLLGRRDQQRAALERLSAHLDTPSGVSAQQWGLFWLATGSYSEASAALGQALASADEGGDMIASAAALVQLGQVARRLGDYERASLRFREALQRLGKPDGLAQAQIAAQALVGLGIVSRQQGDFAAARAAYQRALTLCQSHSDRRGEADALSGLGVTAYYQHDFAAASAAHEQALDLRRSIGDRSGEGSSLYNLALTLNAAGRYHEGERALLEALVIQRLVGNRWEEGNVLTGLGTLYQDLGDLRTAERYLRQALDLSHTIGDDAGAGYVLCNLGMLLRDQSRLEEGTAALAESFRLAEEHDDAYLKAHSLSQGALIALAAGDAALAQAQAAQALELRRNQDLESATSMDLATLSAAALALGEHAEAAGHAAAAIELLDRLGDADGLDMPHRDYFICSQTFAALGDDLRAGAALRRAQAILEHRASRIADERLRTSFLALPFNAAIVRSPHPNPSPDPQERGRLL